MYGLAALVGDAGCLIDGFMPDAAENTTDGNGPNRNPADVELSWKWTKNKALGFRSRNSKFL
jgi:hypothetical protein